MPFLTINTNQILIIFKNAIKIKDIFHEYKKLKPIILSLLLWHRIIFILIVIL